MCRSHFPKNGLLLIKSLIELGYLIQELPLENVNNSNIKKRKIKTEPVCRSEFPISRRQHPAKGMCTYDVWAIFSYVLTLSQTLALYPRAEARAHGNQGNGL